MLVSGQSRGVILRAEDSCLTILERVCLRNLNQTWEGMLAEPEPAPVGVRSAHSDKSVTSLTSTLCHQGNQHTCPRTMPRSGLASIFYSGLAGMLCNRWLAELGLCEVSKVRPVASSELSVCEDVC